MSGLKGSQLRNAASVLRGEPNSSTKGFVNSICQERVSAFKTTLTPNMNTFGVKTGEPRRSSGISS